MIQLFLEFAEHCIEQVIRIKLAPILNRLNRFNACFGPVDICYRDGAIQRDDGRIIQLQQPVVQ